MSRRRGLRRKGRFGRRWGGLVGGFRGVYGIREVTSFGVLRLLCFDVDWNLLRSRIACESVTR